MVTKLDKKIITELQKDVPLVEKPYEMLAKKIGITEELLLKKINHYKEKGHVRRLGAVLDHKKLGLIFNPLIVMNIPEEEIEKAGEFISSFSEVTHCYQRSPHPDFLYNLYAMLHCSSLKKCKEFVEEIMGSIKVNYYELLYSNRELKKTSMKYFISE